jgi:hypothetical protein
LDRPASAALNVHYVDEEIGPGSLLPGGFIETPVDGDRTGSAIAEVMPGRDGLDGAKDFVHILWRLTANTL